MTPTGTYYQQPSGYRCFVPHSLPPEPEIDLNPLSAEIARATEAIARLDGVASVVPNPDLFVLMFIRKEAVLSSQIEGTQSTLDDLIAYEAGAETAETPTDIGEVVNYIAALRHGRSRLADFPLSKRLIREMHGLLMRNVRGHDKTPGEFRRVQNWIGPEGADLFTATHVPPPPNEVEGLMDNLEAFLHNHGKYPLLVAAGIAHVQFETIHPFLDGNGRIGRLLVILMLHEAGLLTRPILYASYHLKRNRAEYYERLGNVRRNGDWEGWLKFFLTGLHFSAAAAVQTAKSVLALQEELSQRYRGKPRTVEMIQLLFQHPYVNSRTIQRELACSQPTADAQLKLLADDGVLVEVTGKQRWRHYRFGRYLALFDDERMAQGSDLKAPFVPVEMTLGANNTPDTR